MNTNTCIHNITNILEEITKRNSLKPIYASNPKYNTLLHPSITICKRINKIQRIVLSITILPCLLQIRRQMRRINKIQRIVLEYDF